MVGCFNFCTVISTIIVENGKEYFSFYLRICETIMEYLVMQRIAVIIALPLKLVCGMSLRR
jgi:hypothetical protein